jgi:hypothetical protein
MDTCQPRLNGNSAIIKRFVLSAVKGTSSPSIERAVLAWRLVPYAGISSVSVLAQPATRAQSTIVLDASLPQ